MKTSRWIPCTALGVLLCAGLTILTPLDPSVTPEGHAGEVRQATSPLDPDSAASPDSQERGTSDNQSGPGRTPSTLTPQQIKLLSQLKTFHFFQLKRRRAAEEKIVAKLDEESTVEFEETPLIDVLEFLEDLHQIQIVVDSQSLEDLGIGTDVPISIRLKGISLRSALHLILAPLDLDYVVANEVLFVTTPEVAAARLETIVYSLHHLDCAPQALAEVIQATIASHAAATGGGNEARSTRRGAVLPFGETIIVTHNQRTHERVAELFEQLHRQRSAVAEFRELRKTLKAAE